MKKITVFTVFVIIVLILGSLIVGCTFSITEEESENATTGELLDGYYAKISYHNYTMYASGHYQAFSLLYDYTFYQKKKSALADILNSLKELFEQYGYSVSIDTFSGMFTAEMIFDTTEEYYKAIGYDGFEIEENQYNEMKKSFFYNTYTYRTKTVFEDITKDYKIIGRLLYGKGCREAGIPQEKVLLDYVYGTPYNENTIRSDRDKISYDPDTKLYLHEFFMTIDTADRTIELTQRSPNTTTWYLLAVAIGVVVFSIPFIIMLCKRRRK